MQNDSRLSWRRRCWCRKGFWLCRLLKTIAGFYCCLFLTVVLWSLVENKQMHASCSNRITCFTKCNLSIQQRFSYKGLCRKKLYKPWLLAHLSQRLKWAIVIAHRPSSVCRRPSVNFHIFDFFSRTAWWILMKLGRDEVLMVPYKCCCFSARSAQGWIQGGAKIGHGGSPSSRNFFRLEGYRDKPNA